uniref:Uncharacterized protein n=1 Tax=Arundo donax TaxID=35708 RepID=A0A0A8YKX9_ARUDO
MCLLYISLLLPKLDCSWHFSECIHSK